MIGAASLRELLARVEAADGPDRELDLELHWCFDCLGGPYGSAHRETAIGRQRDVTFGLFKPADWRPWGEVHQPAYTASLDAALALVEKNLPPIKAFAPGSPPSSGWKVNLYRGMTPTGEPHASWECCIRPHAGAETWHRAPTAALAVLCAFLSALLARAETATPDRAVTGTGATAGEVGRG